MDLQIIKDYLRIDSPDEDVFIATLADTATAYIDTMVGTAYKNDVKLQKLADILTLKLVEDMYTVRTTTVKEDKQDRITTSILQSLALAPKVVV